MNEIPNEFQVVYEADGPGWSFEVTFKDGATVTSGWTVGEKEDAERMAYKALEEMGLL